MYRYQHLGATSAQKQRERPKIRIKTQNGPYLLVVLVGIIACVGLGFAIVSFVRTGNNGNTITMTEQQLITLIEERIMTINGVNPQEPSKKKTATEGGIELVNQDNSIVITTNPSEHEIYLNINENLIQQRIENFCGPESYATAVLVNGSIQCTNLNENIARLDQNNLLPVENLPLSILQYQCVWNSSSNDPFLEDADCNNSTLGHFYTISYPGDTVLGGYSAWVETDWLICAKLSSNPDTYGWQKNSHTNLVTSVNGKVGAVELDYVDLNNRPTPTCPDGQAIQSIDDFGTAVCGQAGANITNELAVLENSYTPPVVGGTPQPAQDIVGMSVTVGPGSYLLYYQVNSGGQSVSYEIRDGNGIRVEGTAIYLVSGNTGSSLGFAKVSETTTFKVVQKSRVGVAATVGSGDFNINNEVPSMESGIQAIKLSD